MRVVHAHWSTGSGRLLLWGEDSTLPAAAPRRPGRRPRVARLRPHPFACSAEHLRDVAAVLAHPIEDGDDAGESILLLPSSQDGPCCSPGLLRDEPTAAEGPAGLAPWSVPALALAPEGALDLLLALPAGSPGAGAPEVAVGAGLRLLAEVAKLAIEVVAQGRVAPALESRDGRWMALWRPWRLGDDAAGKLELLSGALPPLGRAALETRRFAEAEKAARKAGWERTPAPPARAILEDLLAALVDRLARDALGGRRLAPARRGRRPKVLPAAEAWLLALAAPEATVSGTGEDDLANLQAELDAWLGGAADEARGSFRTCFRLMAPVEGDSSSADDDSWQVDFLLQALDDPSLLVPAEKVWKTRRGALTVLERRLENPQEHLLGELGRASSLYPALEAALRSARPAALALSTEGAWSFLREAAPLLEQSGFGVLVPAWWKKPTARLGVKARVRAASDGAATSSGLLEQALAFLSQRTTGGEMSAVELLRVGLGVEGSPAGLPVVGLEADGRLGELLAGEARLRPRKTPRGFRGRLRPYQQRGLAWLAFLGEQGLGACLADDMGLGKTVQVLALLVAERASRRRRTAPLGPTLLVCPMSVVGNWQREAERFAPGLAVYVHHGPDRLAGDALADGALDSRPAPGGGALGRSGDGGAAMSFWSDLSLFPASTRELQTVCSCPDWANPCKHLAATCYILAERFDEDPFLIFAWRGRTQEELVERLRALRGATLPPTDTGAEAAAGASPPNELQPLGDCLEGFFETAVDLCALHTELRPPEIPDAVLRQVGPAPVELRGVNLADLLAPAWPLLSEAARARALEEEE